MIKGKEGTFKACKDKLSFGSKSKEEGLQTVHMLSLMAASR